MPLDYPSLPVFFAAALALLVMPGPAVMYIVARSVDQGRAAGLASVIGIEVGSLFHILAAALGLSAILATSALAFGVVKYAGAAYLVYLGIRKLWLDKAPDLAPEAVLRQGLPQVFAQGVVVNLLNPKTALFFFAFLPQFVDPARGAIAVQVLLLGAMFVGIATCTDSLYALVAGTLGGWLKQNRTFLSGERYVAGGTYIALGVVTALGGRYNT